MAEEKIRPADMPAGHKRDEARRVVKDRLEEQIELNRESDQIESIDASKLAQRDNEILRYVDPVNHSTPVENPQPGYRYMRITVADGYGQAARANIRAMHEAGKRHGYVPVSGDDPEDARFKSNDCASGTTLRGLGDTLLYRIREEDYQRLVQLNEERARRLGAVEENSVIYAQERLGRQGMPNTMHGAAGDFSRDPYMARRFAPGEGRPVVMQTTFSEADIRRGSIPGMPASDGR